MGENWSTSTDMVEVTDSLEAIAVFRGWKNVFLTLLILCLLVVQGGFWLIDRGIITPEEEGLDTSAAIVPEVLVADANATQPVASEIADANEASDPSPPSFLKMDIEAFDLPCLTKTLKIANGLMLLKLLP